VDNIALALVDKEAATPAALMAAATRPVIRPVHKLAVVMAVADMVVADMPAVEQFPIRRNASKCSGQWGAAVSKWLVVAGCQQVRARAAAPAPMTYKPA
jgi:hypothetical protein